MVIKGSRLFILSMIIVFLSACHYSSNKPTAVVTPSIASPSQNISQEQLLRIDYVSSVDNAAHQYFVYLPRGYSDQPDKKWPIMLFLHGNGERGNGRDELDYVICHGPLYEAWIQKKNLPFIIISPQLPMFGMETLPYIATRTRAQIPKRLPEGVPARDPFFATPGSIQPAPPIENMKKIPPLLPMGWEKVELDLLAMLDRALQTYHADATQIYLTGLSYGGFGTWYMASKHPELFAAIMPVVGWGHPDLVAPIARHKIPVWAFAGGRDYSVDKKYFYPGLKTLEDLGDDEVRFTVEEDMAHDTWRRVYARDDVYQWLLEHHKK